jgi:hypothetical protein
LAFFLNFLFLIQGADTLWREYDQYEHGINKALAKEFLAKLQPLHLLAKVLRTSLSITNTLTTSLVSTLAS